jgi:hypothetical protein
MQRETPSGTIPNPVRWLLKVTAAAASAAQAFFEQQQLLRSVAQFDAPSRTWWVYIGALDVRALRILECLFEPARRFGTEVRVQAIAAPDGWAGPCFSDAGELADLVAAGADCGRTSPDTRGGTAKSGGHVAQSSAA